MIQAIENNLKKVSQLQKKWGWMLDSVDEFSSSADSKIHT